MILDIAYKLARKAMTQSAYDFISFELLGRRSRYERWETYRDILAHYRSKGLEYRDKVVAEIGCGRQYFTALGFLAGGARQVHMVEPKLVFSPETLAEHLKVFNRESGTSLGPEQVQGKIFCHQDSSALKSGLDGSVDLICSFTVLEHVGNLAGFFADMARLLREGGTAYHMVDVSDHTYQVFARWPLLQRINHYRGLYHLRYSGKGFSRLNDPKCFMNRELLPTYLALAKRNGLDVESLETAPYREKASVHPEVLAKAGPSPDPEQVMVTSFSLLLRK
jgi:SAM-dependent methyltransferase